MINRALKTIRQFHGLTQAEIADRLGISKSYVSEIESGKKSIGYELLQNYSEIFDIPLSSLVFFSESLEAGHPIPQKFRRVVADKIIKIMEWVILKDEAKTT